jgi:hypothetical protein
LRIDYPPEAELNTVASLDLPYLLRAALAIPDYWHPYLELQAEFLSGKIGRYPVTMDRKADYPGQLDDEGVPIVFWGPEKKASASPVNVVLYGLGNHDVFLRTRQERHYSRFLAVLRWLKTHNAPLGAGIGWPNHESVPMFGLKAPWFSAITQGLVLSIFVRASRSESTGPWSDLARKTWLGYHCPISRGGFCRDVDAGLIYEEYPGPHLDCVFNGMCCALIGLWEAWKSGLIPEAEDSFKVGVGALRSYLPQFDRGDWSLYSLSDCLSGGLLSSPYYHRANALYAQVIGHMARDAEFNNYGDRWLQTSKSLIRRVYMSLRIGIDRYVNAPSLLHRDKSKTG